MQYSLLNRWTDFSAEPSSRFRKSRDRLQKWWNSTTSDKFLASPLTQRDMRTRILPGLWLAITLGDATQSSVPLAPLLWVDIPMLVTICCLSLLPVNTMRSDVCITLATIVSTVSWFVVSPPAAFNGNAFPYTIAVMVLVLSAVGIHTLLVLTYWVVCFVFCAFVYPSILSALAPILIMWYMKSQSEARCAEVCEELHGQQNAVRHLLDGASDGSCTVSASDSTIISGNARLGETLGKSNIVGMSFAECLNDEDLQRLEHLVSLATPGAMEPVIVTVSTPPCDFEAKLIPYCAQESNINLCVQIQGERRFRDVRHAADRVRAGTSEDGPSITNPSAFLADTHAPTSLAYSQSTATDVLSTAQPPAEVARQTNPEPSPPRLPPLPDWMTGRPDVDSGTDAGSERSGAIGARRGGRRRRGLAFTFEDTPVVPGFQITGEEEMKTSIRWLVHHWNTPKASPQTCCCQFHAACNLVSLTANRMVEKMACKGNYKPHWTWQCSECNMMNSFVTDECDLCYEERPQVRMESTHSRQTSSAPAHQKRLSL